MKTKDSLNRLIHQAKYLRVVRKQNINWDMVMLLGTVESLGGQEHVIRCVHKPRNAFAQRMKDSFMSGYRKYLKG